MIDSTIFDLQVAELLKSISDERPATRNKIDTWLKKFKKHLSNISEKCLSEIGDFKWKNCAVTPIAHIQESKHERFKFIAPKSIIEVGSSLLGTQCSSKTVIDVAVEIPKVWCLKMDFLNHRYHQKRAFYLSCIASALMHSDNKSKLYTDLKFKYQNECYLKPVLLIVPEGIENITVCLTAYPSADSFKLHKFVPSKNNIRYSWFLNELKGKNLPEEVGDETLPTPYYNASFLCDILLPELNRYLKENITTQCIKDGIKLLKLWCLQRSLTGSYGRLNGFIISMYVIYLLKKKKLSSYLSAYQVFRKTLLCLQTENWFDGDVSLCNEMLDPFTTDAFQNQYDVLFLDPSGVLNLCYFVNKETILRIQHEAKLALPILDKESPEGFMHLLMTKISFTKNFEYLIHLNDHKKFPNYMNKMAAKKWLNLPRESLNFGENIVACLLPKMCEVLKEGLNSRISLIDILKEPHDAWPVNQPPPESNSGRTTIGLLLNPNVPFSSIEKGPVADDPKAKEFRQFWEDLSELRRFADGTIREAVHWPSTTMADKRKVFSKMIFDILKIHLGMENKDVYITGTEVECVLELPKHTLSPDLPPYGIGEEAHVTLEQSFNSLCKQMRGLTNLPLLIASIQGASPSFRFTEVFPPLSVIPDRKESYLDSDVLKLKNGCGNPPFIPPLKAIITFEGSGKWPDDVEAIKRVKAAFYIKLAKEVKGQLSLRSIARTTHTDIFKDGFVFRFEIYCHKEIFLLKQVRTASGSIKVQENKESRMLEISMEIIPKLNSMLHGLHQQHKSFGTACRLAKRWVYAQLKNGFLCDVAVELLVASLYVHPEPVACPSSPQVAFFRFLTLLVDHDWAATPLIVNLNNELTASDMEEIRKAFNSQRTTLPAMVIPNPLDRRGNLWTQGAPPLILKRIVYLAEASLKVMEGILNGTAIRNVKLIFRPPLDSFDLIIYLNRNNLTRLSSAIDVCTTDKVHISAPYRQDAREIFPIVGFDPVQKYLEELRETFGEFAYFLHDSYGGDFIAVVWKMSSFQAKELKVSRVNCRTLHSDGIQVIPDVERILEDFEILGSGLVKKVVKQTQNWQIP